MRVPLVKNTFTGAARLQDLLDTATAMRMKQTLQLLRRQLVQLGETLKAMALGAPTYGDGRQNEFRRCFRHDVGATRQQLSVRANPPPSAPGSPLPGSDYRPVWWRGRQPASVGSRGMAIRKQLMGALGLSCPVGMSNASQDHVVEVVQFLPRVHAAVSHGQRR